MTTQYGIWLDNQQAHIVRKKGDHCDLQTLRSDVENRIYHVGEGRKGTFTDRVHHHNDEKKFDRRRQQQLANYMVSILDHIKDADEIYVMGPAEAKNLLKIHISEQPDLNEKLLAVEASDKMTEKQLIAKVRSFFDV